MSKLGTLACDAGSHLHADLGRGDAGLLRRTTVKSRRGPSRRQLGYLDRGGRTGRRPSSKKKRAAARDPLHSGRRARRSRRSFSGSVEIGGRDGDHGACSPRFSKGAPVRIIGGRDDRRLRPLLVRGPPRRPSSPLKDTDGKTIAYSTNGSSTHGIVTAFMKQYDLKAKAYRERGGPAPTHSTQVMSNQISTFGLGRARRLACSSSTTEKIPGPSPAATTPLSSRGQDGAPAWSPNVAGRCRTARPVHRSAS